MINARSEELSKDQIYNIRRLVTSWLGMFGDMYTNSGFLEYFRISGVFFFFFSVVFLVLFQIRS